MIARLAHHAIAFVSVVALALAAMLNIRAGGQQATIALAAVGLAISILVLRSLAEIAEDAYD